MLAQYALHNSIELGFAAAYVVLLWWSSTGALLFLDGLARRHFPLIMVTATGLLLLALAGISATLDGAATVDAYCSFTCALLVWTWLETSYFLGYITGPRREPCPPEARNGTRFFLALQTSLYHELMVALTGIALFAWTAGHANQTAAWTFAVLWLMRWSAKLNLFLGVRNLNEDWLPEHLNYLSSYMRKANMNGFLPVSVTLALAILWMGVNGLGTAQGSPGSSTGQAMALTLLALAIVEHGLLVLPISANGLWQWGLRSHVHRQDAARDRSSP